MPFSICVCVTAHDVTAIVDSLPQRGRCAGEINCEKCAVGAENIRVLRTRSVTKRAYRISGIIDAADDGLCLAGQVDIPVTKRCRRGNLAHRK